MNILIVDDELSFKLLIRDILVDEGHTVILAENGKEGISKLYEQKIDIVISDLHMHVMDGLTFCTTTREIPEYRDIPFLFVSAYEDENSLKAMNSFRNSSFLRKGSSMGKLLTSLRYLTTPKDQDGGFTSTPAPEVKHVAPEQPYSPTNYHILIVDDDDAFRMMLNDTLWHEGYIVTAAPDGEMAIELVQKEHYDLVLLDIMMPTIPGFEVLKFIKQHVPSLDVIMLTGYADFKLAIEAKTLGAKDFIAKPFMRQDLLNTIKTVLTSVS
jgi:CheY-like chemotaxis protein